MTHPLFKLCPSIAKIDWHENKRSLLSIKRAGGLLFLSLHQLFYDAPTPVLEAIVRFALKKEKSAKIILKEMAHLYFTQNAKPIAQGNFQGKVYNLKELLQEVYTLSPLKFPPVTIVWSKGKEKKRYRSITFGTYDSYQRQIRIHPILDGIDVPRYVILFIIYHELLHSLFPVQIKEGGRREVHSLEFKKKEKEFPKYMQATRWLKEIVKKGQIHGRT